VPKGSYVGNLGCKALTIFHKIKVKQVAQRKKLVACGTRALLDHSPEIILIIIITTTTTTTAIILIILNLEQVLIDCHKTKTKPITLPISNHSYRKPKPKQLTPQPWPKHGL